MINDPLTPLTVTDTSTTPTACAGVTAVIEVELTTTTEVAATPPMATEAPAAKLVPVMVIVVPPAMRPLFGVRLPSVGVVADGVAEFDDAPVDESELAFVAITVNTYEVALISPVMVHEVVGALTEQVKPDGVEVTL